MNRWVEGERVGQDTVHWTEAYADGEASFGAVFLGTMTRHADGDPVVKLVTDGTGWDVYVADVKYQRAATREQAIALAARINTGEVPLPKFTDDEDELS